MIIRPRGFLAIVSFIIAAGSIAAFPALLRADARGDAAGNAALAEHFASLAMSTSHQQPVAPAQWKEAAALLRAAASTNPAEPRFPRLLVEALLREPDPTAAIDALSAYRKLAPNDQSAQVQQIQLYLGQMQTADEKVKYLKSLLSKTMVPAEVRSVAAVECAHVLQQQSKTEDAVKMLDEALQLNPLNNDALQRKFTATAGTSTPLQRVGMLIAMIRSNPDQPLIEGRLAHELAAVGLVQLSLDWYGRANTIYQHTASAEDPEFARGAAAELFIAGQSDSAAALIDALLKAAPNDTEAWWVRLAIAKAAADHGTDDKAKDAYSQAIHGAAVGLTNNLQEVRKYLGATSATTQPSDDASDPSTPDVSGDLPLLQKNGQARVVDDYIAAVQSLAWFDLYFRADSSKSEPLLAELRKLLPDDDVILARLSGWQAMVDGKFDQAAMKFSAVQDRDAFAALGVVLTDMKDPAKQGAGQSLARTLLSKYPSGPTGAVLFGALGPMGASVTPTGPAQAITTALEAFPMDWLDILSHPQDFYILRADPTNAPASFGDPLFVEVSITNISRYPLTMGPDGVIHPDLWFDARSRGMVEQPFPGVAFDRLDGQMVLQPRQTVARIFRVDQGGLELMLSSQPILAFQLEYMVMTNPTSNSKGVLPGPAGYQVRFDQTIERLATPLSTPDDRNRQFTALTSGAPAERFRAAEVLAAYAMLAMSPKSNASPEARTVAADFIDRLKRAVADPSTPPCVKSWTSFMLATLTPENDRQAALEAMTADADWHTRLLGLVAGAQLPDRGKALYAKLADDKESIVRDFAAARAEHLQELATTTQPSTTQQPEQK